MTKQWLSEFQDAFEHHDMWKLHELRKEIFGETIEIVRNGSYEADGKTIALPDPKDMMEQTAFYTDPGPVSVPERTEPTMVEVLDSDSLLGGKKLLQEGYRPALLNFANRQTPGGGVLGGAGAQEENIFRRSDLFMSLYQFHAHGTYFDIPQRPEHYPMDRNTGGIYSPDVTVFRGLETDGYPLLAEPFRLGIITVAALNRPDLKDADHLADPMVEPTLRKMRTIFRIGLKHGHDALVLGAWGCGAFSNPPRHIAQLFHQVMEEEEFRNRYRKIIFAIIDRRHIDIGSGRIGNFPPFREEFSRGQ